MIPDCDSLYQVNCDMCQPRGHGTSSLPGLREGSFGAEEPRGVT